MTFGINASSKHLVKTMRGIDLGPLRFPQLNLSESEIESVDIYAKSIFEIKLDTNFQRFMGIMAANFTPFTETGKVILE